MARNSTSPELNPSGTRLAPDRKWSHLTHPKPQPQLVKIPIEMHISRLGEGSNVMWVRPQAFPPHMQTALNSSSTFSNAGKDFHIGGRPSCRRSIVQRQLDKELIGRGGS